MRAHPDLVTMVEYGQTYEKRPIYLLKVKPPPGHIRCWFVLIHCELIMRTCLPDWRGIPRDNEESHLDGLRHPRQGVDRPGFLSVLRQAGQTKTKKQNKSLFMGFLKAPAVEVI